MDIAAQLKSALKLSPHQREKLAATLSVSASTIDRWANGSAQPSVRHRKALEPILSEFSNALLADRLLQTFSASLAAAREAMHRHGAASSRNDALDQISLILISQLGRLRKGEGGIQTLSNEQAIAAMKDGIKTLDFTATPSIRLAFERTSAMLIAKPAFLADLLGAMSPTLYEIEKSQTARSANFHELFVSFLTSSFHEEKEFAQYMTPREVTDFMTRVGLALTRPSGKHPVVLDPSCGTASFLTDFADLYASQLDQSGKRGAGRRWLDCAAGECLVGIDTSERMVRLACASFITAGIQPKCVLLDNAIQPSDIEVRKILHKDFADLILTNPPFGAEHSKGAHGGRVPSEVIFLSRYAEWLKPGGVGLTIVPDSVLTNKGLFERTRRELLAHVHIEAVISLPPVTFAASGTTTKTSVLVFRKKTMSDAQQQTFFAVAEDVGFQVSARGSIRKRIRQGKNQLPEIADALLFGPTESDVGVWRSLTPQCPRWDAHYWNAPMMATPNSIKNLGKRVTLSDIADLVEDRADPRKMRATTFQYIEISGVDGDLLRVSANETLVADAPSRARRRVRAGDILISTVRPERRTVGVVPPTLDGAICSTGFAVLRSKSISPYALAAAMRSKFVTEQLIRVSSGVAYPAFEPQTLTDVELEVPDGQWLEDCARYGEALLTLEAMRDSVLAA
jgi:type I restriction enzyme S subunit